MAGISDRDVHVYVMWLLFVLCVVQLYASAAKQNKNEPKQKWSYVNVRQDAHMFWWLYYAESFGKKPLILWLQGGPGGSSTGFGNFQEIGPLDVNLDARETTWLLTASLLFIDNPVGTGYSYATSEAAFARDVQTIASDLVSVMTAFLKVVPEFKTIPFYIFSESYGGKMTAAFSMALDNAISGGSLACNFKGFAMGDSWISPEASTLSWAPYLFATSVVDEEGLRSINKSATQTQQAIQQGQWDAATKLWDQTETVVARSTNNVNFYNILKWGGSETKLKVPEIFQNQPHLANLYNRHVKHMQTDPLSTLMNGMIREKLGVIPKNVTWGGQTTQVFKYQSVEFMKPVVDIVDKMLNSTGLSVVVYSGQLDLIVNSLGTEAWIQTLRWPGLSGYNSAQRTPMLVKEKMAGFVKKFKNFSFYWILDAGHMVPSDAGWSALQMVKMVTGQK